MSEQLSEDDAKYGHFINEEGERIRPHGVHVLVRRLEKEQMSAGGIHFAETHGEENMFCEVLAIGRGTKFILHDGTVNEVPAAPNTKIGDLVVIRQMHGDPVHRFSDKNVLVVHGAMVEGSKRKKKIS